MYYRKRRQNEIVEYCTKVNLKLLMSQVIKRRLQVNSRFRFDLERLTAPAYLRTFALFAYIAGFTFNRSDLRLYIERIWIDEGDILIQNWMPTT